jgi:hypothetical protein
MLFLLIFFSDRVQEFDDFGRRPMPVARDFSRRAQGRQAIAHRPEFSLFTLIGGVLLDGRGRPEPQTRVENFLRRNVSIAIGRRNGRGRGQSRRIEEDSDHIQIGQGCQGLNPRRKLFELGRADRSAVACRMAHGQASVFAVAHEEGIIKKQSGKQETDQNPPGSGGA